MHVRAMKWSTKLIVCGVSFDWLACGLKLSTSFFLRAFFTFLWLVFVCLVLVYLEKKIEKEMLGIIDLEIQALNISLQLA